MKEINRKLSKQLSEKEIIDQETNAEKENYIEDLEKIMAEHENLKLNMTEFEDLKLKYAELTSLRCSDEKQIFDLKASIESYQKALNQNSADMKVLTQSVQDLEKQVHLLKTQKKSLKEENSELVSNSHILQDERSKLNTLISSKDNELESIKAQSSYIQSSLQQNIHNLTLELNKKDEE